MRVVNERLLATYRTPGPCEACGRWCERREAAHYYARGMGGAGRMDVKENLLALGPVFACACHQNAHAGNIPRRTLLAIIAKREKMTVEALEEFLLALRRKSRKDLTGPGKGGR